MEKDQEVDPFVMFSHGDCDESFQKHYLELKEKAKKWDSGEMQENNQILHDRVRNYAKELEAKLTKIQEFVENKAAKYDYCPSCNEGKPPDSAGCFQGLKQKLEELLND